MPEDLESALERARALPMTDEEQEAQRRSFVYGNANIENEHVTREIVNEVAVELARHGTRR